jgi:hypothetical protein
MTTPHPRTNGRPSPAAIVPPTQPIDGTITGAGEEWGPLVRQPAASARLARILHRSAQDLWDSCTLTDPAQMWEEARAIASRILASCSD